MLVLTRKSKQQIQIGPNITITILQVKGQAVRVGIDAPRNVSVLRMELAQRLADGTDDETVIAALEKIAREKEISSASAREETSSRSDGSARGSLRCRAPRVDDAPVIPPYSSTRARHRFCARAVGACRPDKTLRRSAEALRRQAAQVVPATTPLKERWPVGPSLLAP